MSRTISAKAKKIAGSIGVGGVWRTTFGNDVEFAFVDRRGNAVASNLLLGDSVHCVRKGWDGIPCVEIESDGRQGEMRWSPAACRESLVYRAYEAIFAAATIARSKGLKIKFNGLTKMPMKNILAGGPKCIQSGCNPDFTVNGEPCFGVEGYEKLEWCISGAHIHMGIVGIQEEGLERVSSLLKLLDLFCGIPMSAMSSDETEFERRRFYGKPGCHRIKPYGLEYRTPGPSIMRSPVLFSIALGMARYALTLWALSSKQTIKRNGLGHVLKGAGAKAKHNYALCDIVMEAAGGYDRIFDALVSSRDACRRVWRDSADVIGIIANRVTFDERGPMAVVADGHRDYNIWEGVSENMGDYMNALVDGAGDSFFSHNIVLAWERAHYGQFYAQACGGTLNKIL